MRAKGGPLSSGTLVDHFRIMRPIARGGMGDVYLARDSRLGRRVALKIIRTEHEGSDDATRALLFEAQTIARFSHPNIVTVFAVGEYEGRPYLALEYLEGDNLEERLEERRLNPGAALRIAQAICDAVTEAHANGVLHLDLKPANVIIPSDGRLRVLDFGLAKIVREAAHVDRDEGGAVGWGTPAYTAPEQWQRLDATAATDVWSFGVMLYELLSGRLPWAQPSPVVMGRAICSEEAAPRVADVADVPPEADELIARCLDKDPAARPSAKEIGEAIAELVGVSGPATMEESPFRGLLPFTSRHAGLFFGREDEVSAFAERARHHGVLPIVGPSGSGKSSFVQAGVIPRLREQGDWVVLRLRPGGRPFHTLVDRLRRRDAPPTALHAEDDAEPWASASAPVASLSQPGVVESARITPVEGLTFDEDPADVVQGLIETPRKLALLLRRLADETGRNVLLVVEQLEQLLSTVDDARTRRRFVSALCTAADDASEPVRVIFTVRDDVLGRIATGPEVREALANMTVLQSLDGRALQRVLVAPVEAMGYRYEDPTLVDRMSAAVLGEPGSLPLLQFAAQKLWELRDVERRLLLTVAYEAMGGVEGALAQHADEVVAALSDDERRVARRLLVRLVTPVRQRRAMAVGRAKEGLGEDADDILDRLAQSRIVTVTRGRDNAGPRVELAHESLIRRWSTLVRWLDEERGDALFLAEAGPAAELWERRGRRPEELWRGDALSDAVRRRQRLRSDPSEVVDDFLLAAQHRERGRQRRKRISLIVVVGVSVVIAVAGLVAALVIADKERAAVRARDQAQHQRAVALREAAIAAASSGDLLAARAKLRVALTAEDAPVARALWRELREDPRIWRYQLGSIVHDVAFSPDGLAVAASCQDMAIYVLDVATRQVEIFRGATDQVNSVAWAPDGSALASGAWSGGVMIWDRATRRPMHTLKAHEGNVLVVVYSDDGRWLASGGDDGRVRLWDPQTGRAGPVLEGGSRASAVAFSPDSQFVAAATGDGVVIWRLADPTTMRRLGTGPAGAVAFSDDGKTLAGGFEDATAQIWNVSDGEPRATLRGHAAEVSGLRFDGEHVVTGSADKTVRRWRISNGELLTTLAGHDGGITGLDLDPVAHRLVTASRDRTVRLWDLERTEARREERGHTAGVYRVAFTPDGSTIASASSDQTVRLWDVATGEQTAVLRGHTGGVDSVAVSPDGTMLASGALDMTIRLWDLPAGTERRVLNGHTGRIWDVEFDASGSRLASAGRDGQVRIWDVDNGTIESVLRGHEGAAYGVAFAPHGQSIASAGADMTVRVWPARGAGPPQVLGGHEGATYGVAYGPRGQWLASAGADSSINLWDLRAGTHQVLGPHDGRVYWLDVDAQGKHVAAPTSNGTVTIWSVAQAERVGILRGHRDEVNAAAFSPDGSLVATAADDGTVRVWEVATGRPFWHAPILLLDPPVLYSQRGWVPLDPAAVAEPPGDEQWRQLIETEIRHGAYDASGTACVVTHGGGVQLWSVRDGERLANGKHEGLRSVRASAAGCLGQDEQGAVWLAADSSLRPVQMAQPVVATAIDTTGAPGTTRLLIATDLELVDMDTAGNDRVRRPIDAGATAVGRVHDTMVIGFRDGNLRQLAGDDEQSSRAFDRVPASAVERIIEGPDGVVVAGFANGEVGMWSLDSGGRLALGRLHGRVVHLGIAGGFLYAASDLGHALRWDLDVLVDDYCAVLREVWSRVPGVWSDGRVVIEPPPADHPCAED